MKPLILLDFDGVLFNSAYEAYQVCENLSDQYTEYRTDVTFEEFMEFRSYLTDAWQFCRLYQKDRLLNDIQLLHTVMRDAQDDTYTERFFASRAEIMKDSDWAKLMSPYPFFYQIRPLLNSYPEAFKIISTRNSASILRTLEFFDVGNVEIFGQEYIRDKGSKLAVAEYKEWLSSGYYVVFIDDMNSHLKPFDNRVDLCLHANWGYGSKNAESYTQGQSFQLVKGLLNVANR